MKRFVYLMLPFLFLAACKKRLEVKEDIYFEQVNWVKPPGGQDPIAGPAPMHLELKANGFAGLYPGSGDIVWDGTYKITNKKIKVHLNAIDRSYEFKINSSTELIGPGDEILRLKK